MNRNDAVWYYRLGGQTLGPVPWTEIERLTRDTVEGGSLLVARGGDAVWGKASQLMAAHPELSEQAFEAPPAAEEDWGPLDREPAAPASTAGWEVSESEPSAAAAEVLGGAAVTRDTGPPLSVHRPRPVYTGQMEVRHGLGAWIGQAWEMVTGDAVAFIFGFLLAIVVTIVTIGICGPPLQAGLFVMALKRFRNEPISAGTVFEGFQYFLPAWGVALVQGLLGAIAGGLLGGLIGAVLGAAGAERQMIEGAGQFAGSIVGLLIAAAMFYAFALVVDRNMGTMEAINASWAVTSPQLLSYVGIVFVLQLLAAAGVIACGVGILLTVPLLPCATVAAYMYHFRNL